MHNLSTYGHKNNIKTELHEQKKKEKQKNITEKPSEKIKQNQNGNTSKIITEIKKKKF